MRRVIGYASRTGTRRNLDALRRAGWRLLVSATGAHRSEGFPYAIDNGAWTAHQRGTEFDSVLFVSLLDKLADRADWIVVPDIVGGGHKSWQFSRLWLPRVREYQRPTLIAVQDGLDGYDVGRFLDDTTGIFVGGTTEWKLATLPHWGRVAKDRGCHLHVGRVNSARRIAYCHAVGADSFDGSSASRFAKSLGRLDRARRQPSLLTDISVDICPECFSQDLRVDTGGEIDCVSCGGSIATH